MCRRGDLYVMGPARPQEELVALALRCRHVWIKSNRPAWAHTPMEVYRGGGFKGYVLRPSETWSVYKQFERFWSNAPDVCDRLYEQWQHQEWRRYVTACFESVLWRQAGGKLWMKVLR